MNYIPFNAQVLVELPQVAKETKAGIIKSDAMLKEEQKKMVAHMRVLAVGPTIPKLADGSDQLSPGDRVYLADGARVAEMENKELLKHFGVERIGQVDAYAILGAIKAEAK